MSKCDCDHCKDIREQYYQRHPNGCLMETQHDTVIREAAEVLYWGKHKEEEQRKEKWAEVGPKLLKELITAKHEMACTMLCLLQDDPCGAKSSFVEVVIYVT